MYFYFLNIVLPYFVSELANAIRQKNKYKIWTVSLLI
jgi:preprotein translocase subunit Sec63